MWSVDVGATNNPGRILDVLDANGISINKRGYNGTPTWVVFAIVANQLTSNSNGTNQLVDAPLA